MKAIRKLVTLWALILMSVPLALGQQTQSTTKDPNAPEEPQGPAAEVWGPQEEPGMVEFGGRGVWGDVYGRPDLGYEPNLRTSKLNEYNDIRNNFVLPRARINLDDLFGRNLYLKYQTQSFVYKNQEHLFTVGDYNNFRLQLRYNETPHIYTNTAFTAYTETAPGVFQMPLLLRQSLQTASSTGTAAQIANNLPSFLATGLFPGEHMILPNIERRLGSGLFSWDVTPDWNVTAFFAREHESGSRPIGLILNSSPSASASGQPTGVTNRQSPGTGVELPEPIDYFTNTISAMTEYGRKKWAVQLGYNGSIFENNISSLLFDAPFATVDLPVQIIAPGVSGCPVTPNNCAISATPAHGQMALYPDNQAHYLYFAGAFGFGTHFRLMGMVSPGWLHQDEPFLPYTANTAITGLAPLPATSLHGDKQTLAMNWTGVAKVGKWFELEVKYRHYDYNNDTPVLDLTPIEGDVIGANATKTAQAAPGPEDTVGRSNPSYNRKTVEVSGTWFFAARSAAKVGWQGEWFDRSHRDAATSFENSFFGSVDWSPTRDLLFRVSGRHQDRTPDVYQDEASSDPATDDLIACTSTSTAFTEEQRCHRRFDEAARILDRGDVQVQYDWKNFSFGGAFQTIQQDFNRRDSNSPTPLNYTSATFTSPIGPYYLYGLLKDLSWSYSLDASYTFNPTASAFVEYTRENFHRRMLSRSRTPISTGTIATCSGSSTSTSPAGCDSNNNDWQSNMDDVVDTYTVGMDFYWGKRVWFSPYYTLSAGRGNISALALGDPTVTLGPNKFVLTGNSSVMDYPEMTNRTHEVGVVFKYRINNNFMPKIEYRYQQWDNQDFQTSTMFPYMGCIGVGTVVVAPPCVQVPGANFTTQVPSPFYPYFVVGDTSAARYLFLGADQPSYRAHVLKVTLEYHW